MIDRELLAATTTPLILAILQEGDSYGYELIQRVRSLSDGELRWTDSMLYPVLKRLEASGQIRSYWQSAPNGRRRKYYELCVLGSDTLKEKKRQWRLADSVLTQLWDSSNVR